MTPSLDDFATYVRLPPGTELSARLGNSLFMATHLARRARFHPDQREAQIAYRVLAVIELCCCGGLSERAANDVAERVWYAVQTEHHA